MGRPIEGIDFFVRLVNFPRNSGGCDGAVTPNDDGTFSVYLDARTTAERQLITCDHEVQHIENNDFYNNKSIKEVEGF